MNSAIETAIQAAPAIFERVEYYTARHDVHSATDRVPPSFAFLRDAIRKNGCSSLGLETFLSDAAKQFANRFAHFDWDTLNYDECVDLFCTEYFRRGTVGIHVELRAVIYTPGTKDVEGTYKEGETLPQRLPNEWAVYLRMPENDAGHRVAVLLEAFDVDQDAESDAAQYQAAKALHDATVNAWNRPYFGGDVVSVLIAGEESFMREFAERPLQPGTLAAWLVDVQKSDKYLIETLHICSSDDPARVALDVANMANGYDCPPEALEGPELAAYLEALKA